MGKAVTPKIHNGEFLKLIISPSTFNGKYFENLFLVYSHKI